MAMEIRACLTRLRDIERSAKEGPCDKCLEECKSTDCLGCIQDVMTTAADFIEKHLPSEPPTIADWLRSRSDEELAAVLETITFNIMEMVTDVTKDRLISQGFLPRGYIFPFDLEELWDAKTVRDEQLAILRSPAEESI